MRATTIQQRRAASQALQQQQGIQVRRGKAGMQRNAVVGGGLFTPVCNAPTGTATADYMGLCPNYAYSPLMRKFVDPLPGLGLASAPPAGQYIPLAVPDTVTFPGADYYEIELVEYSQQMHSDLINPTKLRGYRQVNNGTNTAVCGATCTAADNTVAPAPVAHYMGPIILATRDRPVRITFRNNLPTGAAGKLFIPVDTTVMGAGLGPDGSVYAENRATLHLHGGNTPWISDGTPHQWTAPKGEVTTLAKGVSTANVPDMWFDANGVLIPSCAGVTACAVAGASTDPGPGSMTYYYPNQQSGRLMFYHDHAYGITRLNVYAGEAAGYLLKDAVDDNLIATQAIPDNGGGLNTYGIPLVIQDKTFVAGDAVSGTGTFQTDPTWPNVVPAGTREGDLWFPHVYMPNQNPAALDNSGANAMGRWDYGAWFWPVFPSNHPEVPCPTAANPAQTCPGTPNPSLVPEAFMDTAVVNGMAYPFAALDARPYRLRILNATNDRYLNLQMYVADPMAIAITNPGSGYTAGATAPAVTIGPPNVAGGIQAVATAVVSTGSVINVSIIGAGGSGYTAPVVSFVNAPGDTTGIGAAATANVDPVLKSITSITVTSGGTGYTAPPTVVITDAGATVQAVAQADISPAGAILAINVTNPGTGYTAPPTVTIAAPPAPGIPATAVASVSTEVKMVDAVPRSPANLAAGALPLCTDLRTPDQLYLAGFKTGLPPGCWPAKWPVDGRDGGVPDPTTAGPAFVQIGTEGGILPKPVVIPSNPVGYNYNRRDIVVLNVQEKGLYLGPAERADVIVDLTPFAGKTLIMYNDAPAPMPAFDPRNDYYTGNPDLTDVGGAPSTLPGYGPNTRTLMQIRVGTVPAGVPAFNLATLQTALPAAFATAFPLTSNDRPIVPESVYSAAYGATYPDTYAHISDTSMTFTPVGATTAPAKMDMTSKAIQELFTVDYGRMNATLGVELPFTNNTIQTTIPLGYIDPPTEIIDDGQTQIWKLTHNGVDTHAIHFHLFNVQVVNRVGWDGAIRPPDPNELGWKETVRMHPLEDIIVALRPQKQALPWSIPESVRPLDVTAPLGSTGQFTNIDPLTNNPITVFNQLTNFGWEYVWHCHLLGHEENDMMRPIVLKTAPLAIPQNLAAAVATTPSLRVNLSWSPYVQNPANPATRLRILRRTDVTPTLTTIANLTNLAATTFVDTSVAFNTGYLYVMEAVNAAGTSQFSNSATVTTPAPPPTRLATPLNLRAALISRTSVTLVWSRVTGATNYIIERAPSTAGPWVGVGLSAANSFTATGLTPNTSYAFRVTATNGNVLTNSLPSTPVTVKTLP